MINPPIQQNQGKIEESAYEMHLEKLKNFSTDSKEELAEVTPEMKHRDIGEKPQDLWNANGSEEHGN